MTAWCGKIGVAPRLTWEWSQDDYCVYASLGWSGRMNQTEKGTTGTHHPAEIGPKGMISRCFAARKNASFSGTQTGGLGVTAMRVGPRQN
jgi:hypothetical protein